MRRRKHKLFRAGHGHMTLFNNARRKSQRHRNKHLNMPAIKAFGTLFVVLGLILLLSPVAFANPFKHVTIVDGYGEYAIITKADTVGEIYKRGILNIKQGDSLDNMDATIADGSIISIDRSIVVNVTSRGETQRVRTKAGTTREVLTAAGIVFDDDDIFNIELDTQLKNGDSIVHSVVETKVFTTRVTMAYETVEVKDSSLAKGKKQVLSSGENGYKNVEYIVTYQDGKEVSREVKGETVIKQPVSRKVAVGTKVAGGSGSSNLAAAKPIKQQVASPSDIDPDRIAYTKVMNVTAYTHTGKATSTGVMPGYGTVAVHPSVIPYGTKMYIPGYGIGVAQDTGRLASNTIDVFYDTKGQCISWGRKTLTIYFLKY